MPTKYYDATCIWADDGGASSCSCMQGTALCHKGEVPLRVECKGLLIKRKDKITFFKLDANINETTLCGIVKVHY